MPAAATPVDPNHALQVARAAAREAAGLIAAAAADPSAHAVREKRPNDYVTAVDAASERCIVDALRTAFPDHAVVSEETAGPIGPADARCRWYVDPLDGTRNFIHGWPAYAVSIALAVDGRLEAGVVHDVARGETFHAMRGGGAWCGDARLSVSSRAALGDAIVATSGPLPRGDGFAAALDTLGAMLARAGAVRRGGSAALDLAWVAAGRCDAQFDRGLNAWDVAAGALLVQEAGGVVSTFDGGPGFVDGRECVAGNVALHAALCALLAGTARA